jgi:hypothetical protein
MAARAARRLGSRLRHAIAFVAIVWGIAATFVAFEIIALRGMDVALSFPDLVGGIGLSRAVTQSTSCTVRGANGTGEPRPPAAELRDARVGAWLLGVGLGRDAVFRQREGVNAQLLEQSAGAVRQLAGQLRVPAPSVFRPAQLATANIEFVAFVEDDASETARRLAEAFSPQACELFKLAALWGYSEVIRPLLPGERAVFAMEIRHYAQRAEVPEALWSPMMQRLPSDARAEDVRNEMTTLTNGVTTYLAQH